MKQILMVYCNNFYGCYFGFICLCIFEAVSDYTGMTYLKFAIQTRLALNSERPSYLFFLNVGIKGMSHQTWPLTVFQKEIFTKT